MKPDASYIKLQTQLLRLIDTHDHTVTRTTARGQLERQFMASWCLAPDRARMGVKLASAIRLFPFKNVRGMDHCTYYTGAYDQRVIVTQPYGAAVEHFLEDLTLNDGICPEVLDASEWGFHYPGEAKLFILKFPFGFMEAMHRHEKELRRIEIEKLFKQTEAEGEEDNVYAWADADN